MSQSVDQSEAAYETAYRIAVERYAEIGVDVTAALETLATISISLHCWQGDDIQGFENTGEKLGGGLAVTGDYLGKARTQDELRLDIEQALSLIPGQHRLNRIGRRAHLVWRAQMNPYAPPSRWISLRASPPRAVPPDPYAGSAVRALRHRIRGGCAIRDPW